MAMEIEKMKKAEIIEKYRELETAYEELQSQYDALDDAYGELENNADEALQKEIDELKNKLQLQAERRYSNFLDTINTNKDLQNKLYSVFKEYYDGLAKLYCVDIPDLLYETEKTREVDKYTNEKLIKIFENFVDDLDLYESITGK